VILDRTATVRREAAILVSISAVVNLKVENAVRCSELLQKHSAYLGEHISVIQDMPNPPTSFLPQKSMVLSQNDVLLE